MRRLVVLPFELASTTATELGDTLLAGYMARDLAERMRTHGELDSVFSDPLGPEPDVATYAYTLKLATELSPTLVERLELDGVLFGELHLLEDRARLVLRLLTGSGQPAFEWEASSTPEELLSLNVSAATMAHQAFDVVPSAREAERVEEIQTSSLEALRCVALAEALQEDESDEAALQRTLLLRQAVEADPAYADAVIGLASALYADARADEAVEVLELHLAHYNTRAVRLSRARLAMAMGHIEEAVATANLLVEADPYDAEANRVVAAALTRGGRWEEAAFSVQNALWSVPGDRPLTRILARCLTAMGQDGEAHRVLASLWEEAQDDLALLNELAYAQARLGLFDDAMASWERVVLAEPRHRSARQGLSRLLMALGSPGQAMLAVWGDEDNSQELDGTDRCLLAAALLQQGEPALARAACPTLLEGSESEALEDEEQRARLHVAGELALYDLDASTLAEVLTRWAELGSKGALERLTLTHWEVQLALLAGELAGAEERVRGVEPAIRDAIVQRLAGFCARDTQRGALEMAERAATLLAILEPREPRMLVQAAALRQMSGDGEGALTWLSGLLDGAPSAEAVILALQILLESDRVEHADDVIDAIVARSSMPRDGVYEACGAWLAAHSGDSEAFVGRARAALTRPPLADVAWLLEGALERAPELGAALSEILEGASERWEALRAEALRQEEGASSESALDSTFRNRSGEGLWAELHEDGDSLESAWPTPSRGEASPEGEGGEADFARDLMEQEAAREARLAGDAIAVASRLWLALGDAERARQTIERSLIDASAEMEYALGLAADAQGDGARAEASWRRALLRDPSHHEALAHLGAVCMMRGELTRALTFLERALQARPTSGALFNMVRDAMLVTLSRDAEMDKEGD